MMRRTVFLAVLLGALAMTRSEAVAQRPSASFSVIVVFDENAAFQNYRANYRADERAAANPPAWGYLNRDVVGTVMALEAEHGFRADHVYSRVIRGFAARMTARQIDALENSSMVKYIEADGTMATTAQSLPWGIDRVDADISSTLAGNGSGAVGNVRAYIIDTGIDIKHSDLNVVGHVNFAGGQNRDCNGHGTHVAGTVAARDNAIDVVGVAPGAPLTGVKVLGCGGSGTTSAVIKGIDWVTANAVKPAIANMSLGGGASTALDDAVKHSAASGVFYSISAGNSGVDACDSSPARAGTEDGIMTAAATDSSNQEASWSNYGPCVDIWAPGVSILSTRKGGGTIAYSGTSMAAPHVGGSGALYLSTHTADNPADVEHALKSNGVDTATASEDGAAIKLVNVRAF
jgi:subtilisin family serine protease